MKPLGASEAGFTLMEILMVVFIVGLSAGIVVMSLPERSDALQDETARLERVIEALSDRAVLSGNAYGLELTEVSYKAVIRQNEIWVPVAQYERRLPRSVTLEVADFKVEDEAALIVFDPAGVPTDIQIRLNMGVDQVSVQTPHADAEQIL